MGVAGVVAGTGVIESSTILIIGAMAISPDLLPLAAACVGLVGRRPRLVRRSVGTLATGLVASTITAVVATVILRTFDVYDGDLGAGGIHGLVTTDPSTILVVLAAGVAAMLTYESRAGAAVGVAISVTTIPASAYLGVAAASSQRARRARGRRRAGHQPHLPAPVGHRDARDPTVDPRPPGRGRPDLTDGRIRRPPAHTGARRSGRLP